MKVVAAILGFVALLVVSAVIEGLVLGQLWAWFIAPVFNAPVLSVPQAIGLGIVVAFFKQGLQRESEDGKGVGELLIQALVLHPLITLAIGYIVHLFV